VPGRLSIPPPEVPFGSSLNSQFSELRFASFGGLQEKQLSMLRERPREPLGFPFPFLFSQPLRDETSIEEERRYRRDPEIGGIGVEWVQQDISLRRGGVEERYTQGEPTGFQRPPSSVSGPPHWRGRRLLPADYPLGPLSPPRRLPGLRQGHVTAPGCQAGGRGADRALPVGGAQPTGVPQGDQPPTGPGSLGSGKTPCSRELRSL